MNSEVGIIFIIIGVGSRITISISKIKNNTANKKNRRENGVRAFEEEVNPHSNGLEVSRFLSGVDEKSRNENTIVIAIGMIRAKRKIRVKVIIF